MKKFMTVVFAAVIACSAFMMAACDNDDKTTIRLSEVTHSIFYAPLYIAIENGYFEDEGLKIELTNAQGSNLVLIALASGAADIGLLGPEACIYANNEGKTDYPVIFGQLTKRDGSFLVGRNPEPDFEWSNLEGKRTLIGRKGGMPAMTFQYVANQNGIVHGTNGTNLDTQVEFKNMASAFLTDMTVDYTTLFEPTASDFVSQGKGYIVASIGEASGEVPYTAFAANKSYVKDSPDTVKAFLRAVQKGYKYIKDNDAQVVANVLVKQFTDVSVELVKQTIIRHLEIVAWNETPVMTEDAFNRAQTIMENAGELSKRANYAEIVDNTYAEMILA